MPEQPPTPSATTTAVLPAPDVPRQVDRRADVPVDPPPPPLGRWAQTWRYLVVLVAGLLSLLVVSSELPLEDDAPDVVLAVGGILVLDVVLGLLGACLLPLRRRRPLLVGAGTAALTAVSASALAAAALAAVSVSTRLQRTPVVLVGAVWLVAGLVHDQVYWPSRSVVRVDEPLSLPAIAAVLLVAYGLCVGTGVLVGQRRRLLASLRERAATAERQQALEAEMAREGERSRIAREMHDVLAHRISLVALHAGALDYREDLTREQTAQTAGVIRDNAHLALTELRQVLGVLRRGSTWPSGVAEPPQPTLAELPALLADAAEAGADVRLDAAGLPPEGAPLLVTLSEAASRTAFRIVQEALTNARKHAPGVPVHVRLAGGPGAHLLLEVRNAVTPGASSGAPEGGLGLLGLAERAALAGGALEHGVEGGAFVVRARLPWQ